MTVMPSKSWTRRKYDTAGNHLHKNTLFYLMIKFSLSLILIGHLLVFTKSNAQENYLIKAGWTLKSINKYNNLRSLKEQPELYSS